MYEPNAGAVNILLNDFGLINTPINWLTNFEYVIPAVIVAGVWGEISKAAIFLLAGLQTISNDLYEASKIDGAGLWAQFWHITLPVLKPVLAAIISLTFMWNFNTFGIIWVLTQGGPGGMTRLPMLAAYEEAPAPLRDKLRDFASCCAVISTGSKLTDCRTPIVSWISPRHCSAQPRKPPHLNRA